MSTISTSSIEEVAKAAPKAIKWFQLYIYKDREVGNERTLFHRELNSGCDGNILFYSCFGSR